MFSWVVRRLSELARSVELKKLRANDAESIRSLRLTSVGLSALKARNSTCLNSNFDGSNVLGTDVEAGPNLVILSDKLRGQKGLSSCAGDRES